MKIAVFYNLLFGGAKRVVFEQVKGLKKRGHKIDIYTTDESTDILAFSNAADNIYKFNSKINTPFPFGKKFIVDMHTFFVLPFIHKKISQRIDKNMYDLVLVHPDRSTQAPYLLQYLKTPSVYYCEEPLRIVYEYSLRFKEKVSFYKKTYEELTRLIRKKIDLKNTRSATHHLASCYHIRERMIESYEVFPNISYPGIDVNKFKPKKTFKRNQILFVGNKDVVTDGFDLAKEAIKKIPLHIRPKLITIEWKKNNAERYSDDRLIEMYNSSIAILCLSRLETFGLVPLESMACGIPVIATNVSGHRETILSNKSGFLVEFDSNEIAEKIILLTKNSQQGQKIGKFARAYVVKNWNWDKRITELENVLMRYVKKEKK